MSKESPSGISATSGAAAVGLAYNSVIQIVNINGGRLTEKEARERELQYLGRVMQDCGGLEWLSSISYQDEESPAATLEAVFTAQMTTRLEREGERG